MSIFLALSGLPSCNSICNILLQGVLQLKKTTKTTNHPILFALVQPLNWSLRSLIMEQADKSSLSSAFQSYRTFLQSIIIFFLMSLQNWKVDLPRKKAHSVLELLKISFKLFQHGKLKATRNDRTAEGKVHIPYPCISSGKFFLPCLAAANVTSFWMAMGFGQSSMVLVCSLLAISKASPHMTNSAFLSKLFAWPAISQPCCISLTSCIQHFLKFCFSLAPLVPQHKESTPSPITSGRNVKTLDFVLKRKKLLLIMFCSLSAHSALKVLFC